MARYRKRYSGRRSFRKSYGGSRRGRSSGSSSGVYMPGNEFIAGVIAGYTDVADKYLPPTLVVAAAVAPIKGMRTVTNFAKGVVFGNLVQSQFGKTVSVNKGGLL